MAQFRNLVFEGGGVWGIAYQGVLEELAELGAIDWRRLQRVAGASAGAITACLLAVGYRPAELGELLARTDFRRFQDDSRGISRDVTRLLRDYGWYRGTAFSRWLQQQIRSKIRQLSAEHNIRDPKLRPTFRDLKRWQDKLARRGAHLPRLYVVGSNLTSQRREIYSAERGHEPLLPIDRAVRRSMSIPLFFACQRNADRDVLVDGGLTWNYPLNIFDHSRYLANQRNGKSIAYARGKGEVFNTETLGFRLDTPSEIAAARGSWANAARDIDNILDYAVAMVSFIRAIASKSHLHKNDFSRTVIVDVGEDIGFTEFELEPRARQQLISAGRQGVRAYLKWQRSARGQRELARIYRDMAAGR